MISWHDYDEQCNFKERNLVSFTVFLDLWQFFIGQGNESGSVEPAMECRAVSCGQKK